MPNRRIEKLQKLMAADNVELALYATGGNMQYFLGEDIFTWQRTRDTGGGLSAADWHIHAHFQNKPDVILAIPVDSEPVLLHTFERSETLRHIKMKKKASYFAMLKYALNDLLRGKKKVAVGEVCVRELSIMVGEAGRDIEIVDGEGYGESLRLIKDTGEIEKLRQVAEFTDYAMGIVAAALKPGITPRQVKQLIAAIALTSGIEGISFDPAVIAVRSGMPGSEDLFGYPIDEPLSEGTSITFDFGYVMNGYCSDYGRAFFIGKNREAKEAYDALHEAQLHLLERIKPGEPLSNLYDHAYRSLERKSLGQYLRRAWDRDKDCCIMGHQIGIDQHERPWLRNDISGEFLPGMVVCIEPKIMWQGLCYLRMEDMVVVTEKGSEFLTRFDRSRFEL